EIGHTVVRAGGRPCHCPGQGCLEAYASGWAIAERAQERVRTEAQRARRLVRRAGSIDSIDAKSVGDLAHEGDPLCSELMAETATYLSEGVAGIVNAFNPARLILGGGVIEGSPELIDAIRARVRTHCQPPAAEAVEVVRAALGHDAIIVGAAVFARERSTSA
ncbi:MAG: ROK family protein, partial [Thermoplasmata archaeon]|nr:ROK family protein [Thermoplasmata archaeon]